MDFINILRYDAWCKHHEKYSFNNITLDPKIKSATISAIDDNGFIKQRIIGGFKGQPTVFPPVALQATGPFPSNDATSDNINTVIVFVA